MMVPKENNSESTTGITRTQRDLFVSVAMFAAATSLTLAAVVVVKRRRQLNQKQQLRQQQTPGDRRLPNQKHSLLLLHNRASKRHILSLREQYFSSSLSVSYKRMNNNDFTNGPLMITRGDGCYLMDEQDTAYLDTRNNVAHVGHCHPVVVQAVQEQVGQLNTNTRYLHPNVTLLAERLTQLLPDPLNVVFFCNSGSEANDLALRLARAYVYSSSDRRGGSKVTSSRNTIVCDRAYHGHTLGTLQVSPYKYEKGPERIHDDSSDNDGKSCSFITKVPCPDIYRGKHRNPQTAGEEYARYVQEACQHYTSKGERVRAFIVESGMSVAGVILPPAGYLNACVKAVHQAGGLYIADEVQTGFGRLGTCRWAFEYRHKQSSSTDQDEIVFPDIVTVGKPFGNGMPLAAVVTSRKVAQAFEGYGIEYFNTFAGNPVCTAAGLAVLSVLEKENLQQNALEVGEYLKSKFQALQQRLHLIGDIRGSGLFLGIELVRDHQTLEPATKETSFICSTLKSKYHILTSIDGPYDNVLVVKPPMVFGKKEADIFVDCFEKAATIDLITAVDLDNMSHIPT